MASAAKGVSTLTDMGGAADAGGPDSLLLGFTGVYLQAAYTHKRPRAPTHEPHVQRGRNTQHTH